MGTSGVSSVQLEFDLYDEHGTLVDCLVEDTEVTLSCDELGFVSQTFYLSRRTASQKICHCVCYDKMCKTDRLFDISRVDFGKDGERTVSGQSVLEIICDQCGFSGYGYAGIGFCDIKFKKSDLENVTCRRLLEQITEVTASVAVCGSSSQIYFACLGGGAYGDTIYTADYTELDYQGKTTINALVMANSDTGEVYSFEGEGFGTTLEISSPFATEQLAREVWERVEGYVYKAWHCDMADVTCEGAYRMGALYFIRSDVPEEGSGFLAKDLLATQTEFTVDSTGIYFSGGAAPYDDWNYRSKLDRDKLSIGKNVGNTEVMSNGDVVFRNLNKGGGLSEHDNGISICTRNKN